MTKETKKAGEAMSYAQAVKEVEQILEHDTLSPFSREALTICKNAAIECAARGAFGRRVAKKP